MSCTELIESLRKGAGERIRLLWQDAETEAGRIQTRNRERLSQLRADASRRETIQTSNMLNQSVSEANRRGRIIRLCAEKALSDRLYALAKEALATLRNGSYETLFGAMARELPPIAWQSIRVNPEDISLAKTYFPDADVMPDPGITGGMEASTGDSAIRVTNTFEKRLERAWSDMQPELIRDAYLEVKDETSSAAAGGPGISGRIPSVKNQRQEVATDH